MTEPSQPTSSSTFRKVIDSIEALVGSGLETVFHYVGAKENVMDFEPGKSHKFTAEAMAELTLWGVEQRGTKQQPQEYIATREDHGTYHIDVEKGTLTLTVNHSYWKVRFLRNSPTDKVPSPVAVYDTTPAHLVVVCPWPLPADGRIRTYPGVSKDRSIDRDTLCTFRVRTPPPPPSRSLPSSDKRGGAEEEDDADFAGVAGGVRSFLITFLRRVGAQLYRNPLKLFRQSQVKISFFDMFRHSAERSSHSSYSGFGTKHPAPVNLSKAELLRKAWKHAKEEGYGKTFRNAMIPFGCNVLIGTSMFTTYDFMVETMQAYYGMTNYVDMPLHCFFGAGAIAGVVQSTIECPFENVHAEYVRHHHRSYGKALWESIKARKLFHGWTRLGLTEVFGLTVFFGGYETCKRAYGNHLFSEKLRVLNVVAAGLSAGMMYNLVSYPLSRFTTVGPRKMFKGLFPKRVFASMPANAIGFLLYELTLSTEDSRLK